MEETPAKSKEMPERVTAGAELTSSQEATPKVGQKDPKKVAAGRAGAAARKAKQEKLLAELRDAKANMREPVSKATDVALAGTTCLPPGASTVDNVAGGEATERRTESSGTTADWTPWVVGGIGLAGFAWFLRERSKPQPKPALLVPQVVAAAKPATATGPTRQLKASQDPFYME